MTEEYRPTKEQVIQRIKDYLDRCAFEEWVSGITSRYLDAMTEIVPLTKYKPKVWIDIDFPTDRPVVIATQQSGCGWENTFEMPTFFLWQPELLEEAERQAACLRADRLMKESVEKERKKRKYIEKTIEELEAELALKKAELAANVDTVR